MAPSKRRAGRCEYALGFFIVLAGCSLGSGGGSPSPSPTVTATVAASGYVIVALGDDFTVGLGTSACGTQTQSGAPCATSPSQAGAAQQIGASVNNGMMQTFAATFAANHNSRPVAFTPLGVNGALTGKDVPAPQSPLSGNVFANPAQLPRLPSIVAAARERGSKVLLLVSSGFNDVIDAAYTRLCAGAVTGNASGPAPPTVNAPCTASGTTLSDAQGNARNGILYAEYAALFASIAQSAPDAVVYLTVWDLARVPAIAQAVPLANAIGTKAGGETSVQLANDALKAAAAGLAGAVPVDLYAFLNANPTYLTSVAYFAPDGLHFNDQGYKALAGFVYQQFSTALPGF